MTTQKEHCVPVRYLLVSYLLRIQTNLSTCDHDQRGPFFQLRFCVFVPNNCTLHSKTQIHVEIRGATERQKDRQTEDWVWETHEKVVDMCTRVPDESCDYLWSFHLSGLTRTNLGCFHPEHQQKSGIQFQHCLCPTEMVQELLRPEF